jgi:hypothetical protein
LKYMNIIPASGRLLHYLPTPRILLDFAKVQE